MCYMVWFLWCWQGTQGLAHSTTELLLSRPWLLPASSFCMPLGELVSLGVVQCTTTRTLTVKFLKTVYTYILVVEKYIKGRWSKDTKRGRATSGSTSEKFPFAPSDGSAPYYLRKLGLVCAPADPATQRRGWLELRSVRPAWVIQQDSLPLKNQKHALGSFLASEDTHSGVWSGYI